jgi:hypothetical protein
MQDSKIYFIHIIFLIETTGYTLKTFLTLIHGKIKFNALTLVHFIPTLYYILIIIPVIFTIKYCSSLICRGRDSVVGIPTRYGLEGPGIESPWGARFSAPIQTGPGAHPASCTMGTGYFPGVKAAGA